jgi:hypothetical protein
VDVIALRSSARRNRITAGLALAGALALAGCGGSSSGGAPPATGGTAPPDTNAHGAASIVSLDVPASIDCRDAKVTFVRMPVTYTTTGATTVKVLVDGRDITESMPTTGTVVSGSVPDATSLPTSGSVTASVHCDAVPHTLVIQAIDRDGQPTSEKKIVTVDS